MARIAVIGCGYVGGVSAACFAELGHTVECIDVDARRIAAYREGRSPIYEPGLDDLLRKGLEAGRLRFHDEYPETVDAEIVFIAVNTPGSHEGAADLRAVRDAVSSVAPRLKPGSIIVNKSTVPIGTGDLVEGMARRAASQDIAVVSNPEFLREGSAVRDFMEPDRLVLGSNDPAAIQRVADLYAPLNAEIVRVDIRTAEMIKYASNAFLATKVSFINEMASICETLGADINHVARGMGMDARIGEKFLSAGLGWGGSCFPKDVRALAHMAATHGNHPQLLRSVMEINHEQRLRTVAKLRRALGSLEGHRVAVLGAAFKPHTDDTRNSPALDLAALLALEGADVVIADPVVTHDQLPSSVRHLELVQTVEEAAPGAHAIVLATEWPQFTTFDYGTVERLMEARVFMDARNAMDGHALREAGFTYLCIGRPTLEGGSPEPAITDEPAAVGGDR